MCRANREGVTGRGGHGTWCVVAATMVLGVSSCNWSDRSIPALTLTPTSVRAERRAYQGAPPVIPHAPQRAACQVCHTTVGKEVPGLGVAPANPHHADESHAASWNCRQCHLFQEPAGRATRSSFQETPFSLRRGSRLYSTAPPTIPHTLLLRRNCVGCHSGVAARPEIRCSHPERVHCGQCHVRGETQ